MKKQHHAPEDTTIKLGYIFPSDTSINKAYKELDGLGYRVSKEKIGESAWQLNVEFDPQKLATAVVEDIADKLGSIGLPENEISEIE